MTAGQCRMWNQASAEQNVPRSGNVVTGFIPEIWQAQLRSMQQEDESENNCEHQCGVRAGRSHARPFYGSTRQLKSGPSARDGPQQVRSPHVCSLDQLVNRTRWRHARIKLDFAKRPFVASNVLLQQSEQCFGLLRAQID